MVNRNRVTNIVEKSKYKNSNLLELVKTNYIDWAGGNLIEPETLESKVGSSLTETRQRIYSYDAIGNPLEISKDQDAHTVYIWDYNKPYPVAECTNADTGSVAFTSFEADGKGGWQFSGTPSSDLLAISGKKHTT